jgi:aerobic-type carbon monoxide dehydrogenase small subunit (CoxS/CutS family)
MKCIINRTPVEIEIKPGEMLSDVLRYRLGLTGTKIGCNEAECGACTVLVDGESIFSCVYPAERASGKEILTIEGLINENGDHPDLKSAHKLSHLHPLQQAFVLHGAVQCGFCIPGQLMTAYGLLKKNSYPSEDDIRQALKDTLCRCGGYPSIIRAIQSAADALRTHQDVLPPQVDVGSSNYKFIGKHVVRPDAIDKVTGAAIFSDDLSFEGMLYARVKRAGIPHAIVKAIDVEAARQLPGVHAILTAADIPGENNHGLVVYDWPVLVGIGEKVRYVGDAIALVAADSEEDTAAAVELIEIDYEALPVVGDPILARQPDSPIVHDSGNLLKHIKVRKGDMHDGFEDADIILEETFKTATTEHAFIEPECSIARPTEDGRMEVYVGSQIPYSDRNQIARVLGWQDERVRIVGQLMGGGFGGKEDIAGQIHAALLANATGKPVKLLFDRHESMLVHPKRHATQIRVKFGAKSDGRLTAR